MELIQPIEQFDFPVWLSRFVETYQKLGTDNLELLGEIYADDVIFIDPMHQISGFENLEDYFTSLYTNLSSCTFVINDVMNCGDEAALYWTMQYSHPKLNKGKTVTVQGHTRLKGMGDRVIYHRDYLDLGAMIYEHIPVIGGIVKLIKNRANS
ncbi:nuclear transport factor 2 family protein [Thalassotalea euphylliae]|uniref:nuclear transport factor 2 family protein n=1 Tax=Thalassotalea euphylliae TaxID=1655234 RepID=UPI00363E580D